MQRTYGVSANLIQLWLTQFDRGELNDEEAEASVIAEYEAQIAALECKVGQLTMELNLVKKTPRQPQSYRGGRRRLTDVPLMTAVLVTACSERASRTSSICSIVWTTRRARKGSSPVILSHSTNSGRS